MTVDFSSLDPIFPRLPVIPPSQVGLAPENWSMCYKRFPEDIVVVVPI
jgi:hypothetical protein